MGMASETKPHSPWMLVVKVSSALIIQYYSRELDSLGEEKVWVCLAILIQSLRTFLTQIEFLCSRSSYSFLLLIRKFEWDCAHKF